MFPKLYDHSAIDRKNYIIMEYIPLSIEVYLQRSGNSLVVLRSIGIQMIECLQRLHEEGYVHRDIKPENFRITEGGQVKLLDFGICRKFNNDQGFHIREERCRFQGTAKYASLNALLMNTQTRRDDVEALGYVLLHLKKVTMHDMIESELGFANNEEEEQYYIKQKQKLFRNQSELESSLLLSPLKSYIEECRSC